MERNEKILAGVTKTMRGLEIGAGFQPLAPKAQGWNVTVVDHATRADLCAKYHGNPDVDATRIEEVDVVWSGKPLHECFSAAQQHSFDYCVASHLLEHIPDMLAFLDSVERLLKDDGLLLLALPDKRYCFDAFKAVSTTADVLYTRARGATSHSRKTAFENEAYNVVGTGRATGWPTDAELTELSLFCPLPDAAPDAAETDRHAAYVDHHAWYFTPASFRLMFAELRALGRTRFHCESLSLGGGEFFAQMRVDKEGAAALLSSEERLALLVAMLREQAKQYDNIGPVLRQRLSTLLPPELRGLLAESPVEPSPMPHHFPSWSIPTSLRWGVEQLKHGTQLLTQLTSKLERKLQ